MSEADGAALGQAIAQLDTGAKEARLWIDELRTQSVSVANQSDSLVEGGAVCLAHAPLPQVFSSTPVSSQ